MAKPWYRNWRFWVLVLVSWWVVAKVGGCGDAELARRLVGLE